MTITPQAHSSVGASSMYRWSVCPGSVRLSEGVPNKSSVYAEEGSDAHALAAQCLAEGDDAADYIGTTQEIDGRKFIVTEDMAEAVQSYLDGVRAIIASDPGAEFKVEQRFDLSEVYPGCFGTSDCTIWLPATKTLVVVDYKHGAGIPVYVSETDAQGNKTYNSQLQYYGLGALLASKYPAAKVRLVIHQPRCGAGLPSEDEIDAVDLIDFRADLRTFAEATAKPDAPLVPGEHCRFCPAAALCPALAQKAQDMARLEFAPSLSYDPLKLKLALDSREPLKAWLKALDEFAYAEAEQGRPPPGYKLVAKRANRKWRDEGEAVDALQALGHKPEVIYEQPKIKSPAQMEKVVNNKSVFALLIVQESSGHVLVPESDKRPAVKLDAKSEFAAIAADEDLLAIPGFLQRPQKKQPSIFDD